MFLRIILTIQDDHLGILDRWEWIPVDATEEPSLERAGLSYGGF